MDVDKFEKRMWNIIISIFTIVGAAVCVWFTYLVLLYSLC